MTTAEATITDAVRLALDAFGVGPGARVEFVKFRENHVFRVGDGETDRALRLHRPGYRTDAELLSEAATLEAFRGAGLRVPRPVPTAAGALLATFTDCDGVRRQATMQDWIVEGAPLTPSDAVYDGIAAPEPDDLRRLGALMAEMHAIARDMRMPDGYDRAAWDHAGLVGPTALWGTASRLPQLSEPDRAALAAAESRLDAELAALPRDRARFGVIHADLTFENLLTTPAGLVVLDFDDSGEGWYLFDLATVGFWLSGHPRAAELLAALATGYAQRRPILPQEASAWHPLLMARALSYLGWSVDRPDDPTTAYHLTTLLPRIVHAARSYADTGSTGWPALPILEENR